ncbi:hypothetical protein KP509_23G021400 [Ceratopteris richardii]|uniref:Phytocyanin domain-containing protein n=1 Tax=Ceratopteris richardii TaxID=49495 RepID=A0A8T2RXP9_CERRI|nr:hypothetical protein KP509_23G021400 [Ceratopteris richardii]
MKEASERNMRAGCLAVLLMLLQTVEGVTWKVGDSAGWGLGVDYTQWVQLKVFEVGDFLLFTYNSSREDLLEVQPTYYATCTTIDPIASHTDGNTTILLSNSTSRYFISSIPGHCVAGVALEIQVGTPYLSPSPSPAPSSPPFFSPATSISTSPSQSQQAPPLPSVQTSSASQQFKALCLTIFLRIFIPLALLTCT